MKYYPNNNDLTISQTLMDYAEHLQLNKNRSEYINVINRTVINRSYYAAYWKVRHYLFSIHLEKIKEHRKWNEEGSSHLINEKVLGIVNPPLGLIYKDIRLRRNEFDYSPNIPTDLGVKMFIQRAKKVIDQLN